MVPSIPNHWSTDQEYIDLLNYIIEKTKDVESPMSIRKMAREFKEISGSAQTVHCLKQRIGSVRKRIQNFAQLDMNTKVKMLFAFSASVDEGFLKKMEADAFVKVDEKNRITHYKANNGILELRGDQSRSARNKTVIDESKLSRRSLIKSYFKNKNNVNAVPMNKEEKEIRNLIEFITEKCDNVTSPLSICRLAEDFNNRFGILIPTDTFRSRCFLSHRVLSLRTEALVEVDGKNRITKYKANDGNLELRGEHSRSTKIRTGKLDSKQSLRSLIIDYFEDKNNTDTIAKNERKSEMVNLIEFITEKTVHVDTPLNIHQLSKDFNERFRISRSLFCIRKRIRAYCREIQKIDFLNTHTKVKQLFGFAAKLDPDYLKKIQKNAFVEVDQKNRIIKYTANDGSLTLRGNHWGSRIRKPRRVGKKNEKNVVDDDSEEDSDNEGLNHSSDEYSSEEFDSEFNSDEENDDLDETEDPIEPSNTVNDFDNKTPVRNRSGMSIDGSLDFYLPTERSHRSEETEMRKDEEKENDPEITGNAGIKTRSGRLSKKRYPDLKDKSDEYCREEFGSESDKPENGVEPSNEAVDSNNETLVRNRSLTNMSIENDFDFEPPTERSHRSEETEMREDDEKDDSGITGNAAVRTRSISIETLPKSKTNSSTSHTPKTPKRKADPSESDSPKRTKPFLEKFMNPPRMDDNICHDDPSRVELKPFRGILGITNGIEKDPEIQQIPRPHPQVMDVPVKKEYGEEAQTSLKTILNAFKSLVLSLDTTGLSQFRMEIDKKIMETGRGVEVSNKEVILAMEFLIVKLSKHGSPKSSEDSISLRDILLMLRTIILNSSFNGLEVILDMLKTNIEQLKVQAKRIPVSKVECVLRATLDIICT